MSGELGRAVGTVVEQCLAVRGGERVLVIADPDTLEHGERGRNLAELGVGTNDRATLTGNVLEPTLTVDATTVIEAGRFVM